ncbi:MAG: hypothetical protein ACLRMZ_20195 [Blautia marasmi]
MLNIALNHISKGMSQDSQAGRSILYRAAPVFISGRRQTVIGYSPSSDVYIFGYREQSLANPLPWISLHCPGILRIMPPTLCSYWKNPLEIVDNLRYILGMELMHAAQAVDLRGNYKLGKCMGKAFENKKDRSVFG